MSPLENQRVQFRGEFFNVLNHADLGTPGTTVSSPSFGVIGSVLDPRIVQFALKLIF